MERTKDVAYQASEETTSQGAVWPNERRRTKESKEAMKPDIIEELRIAQMWCEADSEDTIPVKREHGIWLFKTAADRIEELENKLEIQAKIILELTP